MGVEEERIRTLFQIDVPQADRNARDAYGVQHDVPAVGLALQPPKYSFGLTLWCPQPVHEHVLPSASVDEAQTRIGFELGLQTFPLVVDTEQEPFDPE